MMDLQDRFQALVEETVLFVPHLVVALVVFVLTLLLSGWVARWVQRAAKIRIEDIETRRLLSRLARWSVIILGTLAALDQVDFDVTGFVAGLGIAGFTIGFALQDIARNFVAGILLLVRQPFNIGDAVEVGDYAGTVLDIKVRDTVIRTWDGELVIVPNMDIFTNAIKNYSRLPTRRRTVYVGLGYGEDSSQATRVFLEAMAGVEGVLVEPAPTLQAEELGDSAVVMAARFWVNQETHGVFDVHSAVVQAIKEAAEREEIDLPYPTQTVRVEGALIPQALGDRA
jgi:small-conductance mechanosensitive channel